MKPRPADDGRHNRLMPTPERDRLLADSSRDQNWKRWGPYLSERQWGTVREDYSADGSCWDYFPHDHARSRAYRWGEDGLLGITDRQCRLCFALALWNGRDPILKERLYGLTGPQGNHGEDVKESYFYLDSTPTHSWMRALYKYPQRAFPYEQLLAENRRRGYGEPEFELADAGAFDQDRYFDVFADYAKAGPDDILIRITVHNRGPEAAELHLLPQLWFRNTWSWGRTGEGYWPKGVIRPDGDQGLSVQHASLGEYELRLDHVQGGEYRGALFTDNETNVRRLFGADGPAPFAKDAFHRLVVDGEADAVNPERTGSKAAFWTRFAVPAGGSVILRLRLRAKAAAGGPAFADFDRLMARAAAEADQFFAAQRGPGLTADEARVQQQAYSGLCWSTQLFLFDEKAWL